MPTLNERLSDALDGLRSAGTFKVLRNITAPMGPTTVIDGVGEVLVFCSNNYLGLADHPDVVAAGVAGLEQYGSGTASVRFICGSLLPAIAEAGDAIVSDALNHASIIDAGRLSRAVRKVYAHSDIDALDQALSEVDDAQVRLVVTDGVFSMEGDVARLAEIRVICDRHDAVLIVDDSHGTGVLGQHGRGTHEHLGLPCGSNAGIDILTSTFGKALGGGNGGFVAGSRDLIDYLVQRSRPHLFSNALAPPTACAALKALEILEREPERVTRLHENVGKMRAGLRSLGYDVMDSPTGIIPIMIGETAEAIRLSDRLLEMGVFVVGFGYPVVPEGEARLRVQMSAAHTDAQIERSLEAFDKLRPRAA
jgi:glycine C-acetyltransferase